MTEQDLDHAATGATLAMKTCTMTADDATTRPTSSALLVLDAGCSVGVALAMAHIRGALVMSVIDESRVVIGAVTRETLSRSSRFLPCSSVMSTFEVALSWRATLRPECASPGTRPAAPAGDADRVAA